MAYSNVTPPTLPSYDSVANPYYLIQFEYAIGAEDWSTVRLWYGSAPLTWNGSAVTNSVDFSLYTYGTGSSEWTAWGVMAEAGEMALTPGPTTADTYMRLYTNHDIKDGTGAVWLAANTVTPTEADKETERLNRIKSQLAGFIAAWCSPSRSFPNREPVAFLYNGVRLPGLPVVEGFDFAAMHRTVENDGTVSSACVFLSTMPLYWGFAPNGITTCLKASASGSVIQYKLNVANGGTDWVMDTNKEYGENAIVTSNKAAVAWANYTVYRADGSVYCEKSDPVPVYE